MNCSKCGSNKVMINSKKCNNYYPLLLVVVFAALGYLAMGFVGAGAGALVGLILGGLIMSTLPEKRVLIVSCNHCGYTEIREN